MLKYFLFDSLLHLYFTYFCFMKLFSVIFSMYILVLSCLPCGDVDDCKVADNDKVSFSKTSHSEHQEDTETCSPFCICACCGTNIAYNFFFSTPISEKQTTQYSQKLNIVYTNDSFSSNFYGNIWQPPKI